MNSTIQEAIRRYEAGESPTKIATDLNTGQATIKRWLIVAGVKLRTVESRNAHSPEILEHQESVDQATKDLVLDLYKNEVPLRSIRERTGGLSMPVLYSILREAGVTLRRIRQ
jgi:cell division protein YceG involved in septum cleavage